MLDQLFNSAIRVKLLALFFKDEDKKLYIQEIIRLASTDAANTHRELIKLHSLKILNTEKKGQQKYYFINKEYEYYQSLQTMFETYNKSTNHDAWVFLEEMPNYYPYMLYPAWSTGMANKVSKMKNLKNKFSHLLTIYKDGLTSVYVPNKEFLDISKEVVDKIINTPGWGEQFNGVDVIQVSQQLFDNSKKLPEINLSALDNKALLKVYEDQLSAYVQMEPYHWIQNSADFGNNLLTRHLMDYLKGKMVGTNYSLGDVFSTLTSPLKESFQGKEYKALLKILDLINQDKKISKIFSTTETRILSETLPKIDPKLNKLIEKHALEYGWIGYGTAGPAWDKNYFIDILGSLVRQKIKASSQLKKIEQDKKILEKKQKKMFTDLKIDKKYQQIFETAQGIVYSKGFRKDSLFYHTYVMENMFREIGKRFYLSVNQARYLYPWEVRELLLKNKLNASELNERYKYGVYYSVGEYTEDTFLTGEAAKKFLKDFQFIEEKIDNIKILQGDCASSGRVRGKVTVVNSTEDMKKMEQGDILVSTATNPDLVPAIKKAAAIVTDVGGITCHAAIISRELGIPCVIGTKIATKVLKDGTLVDVDANHGKVTIVKK